MENNELYHYGVLGMKWGVRRASKSLSKATTKEERSKALASLNKHKEKATAKVNKLGQKHVKLQKQVDNHIQKTDVKISKIRDKATKIETKAYGRFVSQKKAQKRLYKAAKMNAKANAMDVRSKKAKAYLARNERQAELFRKGLNDIDSAISAAGRRYIKG